MKKQIIQYTDLFKHFLLLAILGLLSGSPLLAQTSIWTALDNWGYGQTSINAAKEGQSVLTIQDDGEPYRVTHTGSYVDLKIPDHPTHKYLQLSARGADGGNRINKALITPFKTKGGGGATEIGYLKIGTGDKEIPPGAMLRFIVGTKGDTKVGALTQGADGGAGTGVFMKKSSSDSWVTLMVAGGGGGAYSDCCTTNSEGRSAATGPDGKEGGGIAGGDAGKGGADGGKAFAHGGGGLNRAIFDGVPKGSDSDSDGVKGPFGCGFGGNGSVAGGGGGGYSGGGGGNVSASGGGGGSYLNAILDGYIKANGHTHDPKHGYVDLQFTDRIGNHIISAKDPSKCIDVRDETVHSGSNVQLYDCQEGGAQSWVFEGQMIKFFRNTNQCLEIQGSTPNTGANVEVWGCNSGTNAQKWIYDGVNRQIHSAANYNKCLALTDDKTANNTNIHLWDCKSFETQQWLIDGYSFEGGRAIQLTHSSSDKCIHTRDGWMGNGAWLELWDCLGTTAQQWVVDGFQIKPVNNKGRCVAAASASTTNGTQILLWDCNGGENQHWIYDGVKGLCRSKMDFKKCLSLSKKTIANGTTIQLMDCAITADQQWQVDGALTNPSAEPTHTIHPAYAPDKCFQTKQGSTENGTNVALWDCLGTGVQQWYFSSTYIKLNGDHDKCLTLPVGQATNGTNIYLEDCNGGYRQEWVYDGFTKSIRSVRTPDKCIHIKEGSTSDGANVELWNCMGTIAQQFDIQ